MTSGTRHNRWALMGLLCAQLVVVWGCAARPYRYGRTSNSAQASAEPAARKEVVFKYGEPHKKLDCLSDTLTWPRRKLQPHLSDRRQISDDTQAKLRRYLEQNELQDVQVAVRDYDPAEQWQRLHNNKVVPPLSRSTLGTLSVIRYTLLPGRVFGGNRYNPYTNTLYMNSDSQALLLSEAAFAKNLRERPLPGVYAATSELPVFAAWHGVEKARDVVGYAQAENDWELEQDSYREVYPRVGSQATAGAGALVPVWWGGPALHLAGSAVGDVAGRTALARRQRERGREMDAMIESEVTGVQLATYEEPAEKSARKPGNKRTAENSASARHARQAARRVGQRTEGTEIER